MKLIFSRRKHIASIRARIKAGGAPLTRAEYRLIQTQKDDINKCVFTYLVSIFIVHKHFPFIELFLFLSLPFSWKKSSPSLPYTLHSCSHQHVSFPPNSNASKTNAQKKPKLSQFNTSTCMASSSERKNQKASYLYSLYG